MLAVVPVAYEKGKREGAKYAETYGERYLTMLGYY
jgi:hypothetical protein